jgi:hypothetical protein
MALAKRKRAAVAPCHIETNRFKRSHQGGRHSTESCRIGLETAMKDPSKIKIRKPMLE